MYFFTGNNVFGQWYGYSNNVIEEFKTFSTAKASSELNVELASLVHIGWSHNIFQVNNNFFIAGDYKDSGECLELVTVPEVCQYSSNLAVVSDDYHLVLVNNDSGAICSINLETKDVKGIKLCTEVPSFKCEPKRTRKGNVLKCVAANGTFLFLTGDSLVYAGLLPSLIETSHCVGKPVDVQCGYEHFLILSDAGTVYSWGNGRRLQLGHGDISTLDTPTEIEALTGIKIVKIAAGGWHSLALSEYGDLYAWGWNDMGQLGLKESLEKESLKSYPIPTLVDLFDEDGNEVTINVKDISCGSRHSSILLENHDVWTSGCNKYGQLGLRVEQYPSVNSFKKINNFNSPIRIMCGQWSTVIEAC